MSDVKKRVFLIEDDDAIIEVMQLVLTQAGHNAICVDDQLDVLSQLDEVMPDIIFMDIHYLGMPVQKNIHLIQHNKKTAHIPIVIVSADNDIEHIARRTQVAGFLKKPFEIDELIAFAEKY